MPHPIPLLRPPCSLHSVRVSNLSEDVTEDDLADLFGPFGPIQRIFVAKDRETGAWAWHCCAPAVHAVRAPAAAGAPVGMATPPLVVQFVQAQARPARCAPRLKPLPCHWPLLQARAAALPSSTSSTARTRCAPSPSWTASGARLRWRPSWRALWRPAFAGLHAEGCAWSDAWPASGGSCSKANRAGSSRSWSTQVLGSAPPLCPAATTTSSCRCPWLRPAPSASERQPKLLRAGRVDAAAAPPETWPRARRSWRALLIVHASA